MSTDYNYDEQGQFFPFFILTVSSLVTVPLTYSILKPSKDLENTAPRIQSDFRPQDVDLIDSQKRKQKRRERKLKRMVTVAVGYVVIAWMIYLIAVMSKTAPKIWDPYDILGISRSADEKAIRSHYKRLSIKYHPDKIKPDPTKNETLEMLNDHFVELTKAYKTLTDEEVRNNYIQYGHPDGKQSFSIGIALPKFIVTEGNGKYVLLVYGLLLGVILPYVVGRWWYGNQRVTKEKVLVASAGKLFKEYKDSLNEAGLLAVLSSGEEFQELLKGNKADFGTGKLEKKLLQDNERESHLELLSLQSQAFLTELDGGPRRKALALLWAYLGRIDLEDVTLNTEKYEAAPIALALVESFTVIALAFGNTAPLLASYKISQALLQAVPPQGSPLLQLPHFNMKVVEGIEGEGTKSHMTIRQFMAIPESKRRAMLVNRNLLSSEQYDTAMQVTRQLPALVVEKAFFKVMGERFITPSSLVQFVVKARIIPPGSGDVPEINELDLEDVDPEEGDLDAILGRNSTKMKAKSSDDAKNPVNSPGQPEQPPLSFAPYFPRNHSPRWHMFLADSKQGKIAVPPFTFTTFDKSIFDESGKPTFAMQTLKMQFQAPPQPGQYTFVMHLICDSYIGMDTKLEVTLSIDDMAKAEAMVDEDEISEPDEDSIAGQMNALKQGGLTGAPPPKRKVKKQLVESSDDESDTEGEEDEESATDTDTDTDED